MGAFQPHRQRARTSRLVSWLLAALLLLSFVLRLWDAGQGLAANRYFDERYTLQNVSQILKGELRPYHAYYLSLSYLPQAAMLFRGQNFLPVAPFTSLLAAWAMVESWRGLTRRMPALAARSAAVAAGTVAGLLLCGQQLGVVAERSRPYTREAESQVLTDRLAPLELRVVVYEKSAGPLQLGRKDRALTLEVDRLNRLDPALLDRADAEVFLVRRLDEPADAAYRRRVERLDPSQVKRVSNGLLRSRGNTVILLHPWHQEAHFGPLPFELTDRPQERKAALTFVLPPGLAPGDVLSAVLWVPRGAHRLDGVHIEPRGTLVPTFETGRRLRKVRLMTPRFTLSGGETRLRIPSPPGFPAEAFRLALYRWRREAPG